MDSVDVIWWGGARGMWDQGLLIHAVEGKLGPAPCRFVEHYKWHEPSAVPESGGGILVVPGATEDVAAVKAFVDSMKWCLLVITSDEMNQFPMSEFKGSNRIIWRQHPVPQKGGFEADRVFPTGWRPDTLKEITKLPPVRRDLLWSYCGQVNNLNRVACSVVLSKMRDTGMLHASNGFGQGLPYREYLQTLRMSKLAPSPAGTHNTDCFRIFEALECGALPVVAVRPDTHPTGFNYWQKMAGSPVPFPLIEDWSEFPALAKWYAENDVQLRRDLDRAVTWWQEYKTRFVQDLAGDAILLAEKC